MANPSRYRYIDFYGGRILEAREVSLMQRIQEGLNSGGTARVAFDLDALYREGATFNILPTYSGGSVTLAATNSDLPMYVFVRGRWEMLQSGEVGTLSGLSTGGTIYLNWALRDVNSTEDTTLVDTNTSQPTADMGELDLSVSTTDTSGVSLASNQFEKNTSPVVLFVYSAGHTLVNFDNVNPVAYGTLGDSGLVSLTTTTSNGQACSSDDYRLSNTRTPSNDSITDIMVTPPTIGSGNNADGTPIYNVPGTGINALNIVYAAGTQLLSDAIGWLKSSINSILSTLASHINQPLGSSATHPMPTAAQIGAAPLSHVGLPLGLSTSHPASVTANSGGFSLNRDSGVAPLTADPAYGLFSSGVLQSALYHNGDIYSILNAITVAPLSPATTTGALNLLSTIANVLAEHVNQTSHNNPHGLTGSDINTILGITVACGGSGCYRTWPDGTIEQWGQSSAASGGSNSAVVSVTFPISFTTTVNMNIRLTVQESLSGSNGNVHAIVEGSPTINGFNAYFGAMVYVGGYGVDIGSPTVYWYAIGR
jgi:hypothetical protein